MPRVFSASLLCLVILQVILALVFWAGYTWIGGVVPGALLAAATLILIALPWVGELVVVYDSQAQEMNVKAAWWGSARLRFVDQPELRLRVCGLPYRRDLARAAPPVQGPTPDRVEWARQNLPDLLRFALAALQAAYEITWATQQMTVTLNAPTQIDVLDQILAGVIGRRTLGPFTVQALPEGARRVRVRYRLPLRTVAAAALFVLLQGRARKLLRSWPAARKRP